MKRPDVEELKRTAKNLRKTILKMLSEAGSGHTGGSLSLVEILVSLYVYKMRHDPKKPHWPDRDRLVLSKGHGCSALYAALAEAGYFPKKELMTFRKFHSRLQGHPQLGLPGIEASTGSLGQGLSITNGMALSARLDGRKSRFYCIMGDGELNEGQVWEAAMTGAHYKLDTVCGIVDFNKIQIDGFCRDIMTIEPLKDKWVSFGWRVLECDGHNFGELMDALDEAENTGGKPTVILAHTVKGKGVSFMEHDAKWHGVAPKPEEMKQAIEELDEKY